MSKNHIFLNRFIYANIWVKVFSLVSKNSKFYGLFSAANRFKLSLLVAEICLKKLRLIFQCAQWKSKKNRNCNLGFFTRILELKSSAWSQKIANFTSFSVLQTDLNSLSWLQRYAWRKLGIYFGVRNKKVKKIVFAIKVYLRKYLS